MLATLSAHYLFICFCENTALTVNVHIHFLVNHGIKITFQVIQKLLISQKPVGWPFFVDAITF